MTTRRLFNVVSLVTVLALVMAAVLTIRLTVATTEVVSGSSSHVASALDQHEQSASQSTGNSAHSYRNPLVDECFVGRHFETSRAFD